MATENNQKRVYFCLTSGRSGTTYLAGLIRRNLTDIACHHEPYPDCFGKAVLWKHQGDTEKLLGRFRQKEWLINHSSKQAYIETNHAFLKSFYDVAMDAFPHMKLFHLVRDPLKVARSEANREYDIKRIHFPMSHYRLPDGRRHIRWALCSLEPIFDSCPNIKLSRFQFYMLQWIEIENRAMQFLDRYNKHDDCFTIHAPVDYKDPDKVNAILDFLEVPRKKKIKEQPTSGGHHNKNLTPTVITDQDHDEYAEIIEAVPKSYLEIFHRAPYDAYPWADVLRK